MNKHELHGGARYVGGKVEKKVGDVLDSRDWQVDGVVDQVAGGAENMFGRAQSVAEDVVDATPGLVEEARERIADAVDRTAETARAGAREAAEAARRGADTAAHAVRNTDRVTLGLGVGAAAAIVGFAAGWLANGSRA